MKKFLLALCFGLIMASNALAQVRINGTAMPLTDNCYTVPETTSVESVEIESGYTLKIPSDVALTVTGTVTSPAAACLIIEEGGQLVYKDDQYKDDVYATIKKHIDSFNSNKWYTISTPMKNQLITSSSFCNLSIDDYDMYYLYTQDEYLWVESQCDEDGLFVDAQGYGYLYANDNVTQDYYTFEGVINCDDYLDGVSVYYNEGADLKGFNLIGNPYPHDIYMGQSNNGNCAIYNPNILPYYYTLEGAGTWSPNEYSVAIKPCQGFLIKLKNSTLETIRITNNDYIPTEYDPGRKSIDKKLVMTVSGNNEKDKTIIHCSEGDGLDKIDHISENAPYLCVNYDHKNYAIAHVGSNCSTVDVIFKNNQMGFFTLNVEEGLSDFSYLHLIDNITGDDIDLLMEPSYKFAANGNEYESRFKLVFAPNSNDGIDNTIYAYISNNDIIISGVKEKATLQVYDITGRIISSDIISGTEGSVCRVAKPNVTGVYVLRLIESNNVNTQKIVVE